MARGSFGEITKSCSGVPQVVRAMMMMRWVITRRAVVLMMRRLGMAHFNVKPWDLKAFRCTGLSRRLQL